MTDPISDYLTRLRNAIQAKHRVVEVPASNLKKDITKILFDKGYILNFKFVEDGRQGIIKIALKYDNVNKTSALSACVGFQLQVCVNTQAIKICRELLMAWV